MKRWCFVTLPLLAFGAVALGRPAGPTPPPATHRVRMLQQGNQFKFDPAGLRIRPGDVVEFLNVSGPPHNVQFYPNRIPAGAREVLNRAMPQRMGDLQGPMMMQLNAVYRINFTGAPRGTYDYFCLPHLALGMKATLIVGQPGGPGSTINDGEPTPAQVPDGGGRAASR